ncbi:transcriptional regulator PAI 2-type [Gaertneriomyces semiglobifer]|nr:transcriptional regulator PAI 2-type [Gaertneriomyces semiglobifer]
MWIPQAFLKTDATAIINHIRSNSFGIVTAVLPGETVPSAVHLPCLLTTHASSTGTRLESSSFRPEDHAVITHLAAANPLAKLPDGHEVLVIFPGPHAYVSPSTYSDPSRSVPTWNYTAVHLYGRIKRIPVDHDDAKKVMRSLIQEYDPAWLDKHDTVVSESYKNAMIKGVVVWQILLERVEGQWKLSQNKPESERVAIEEKLRQEGHHDVAELMQQERINGA